MNPALASMIFVFGSNLAGVHGAGAAAWAARHRGALAGVGRGPTGQAYALPTKDITIRALPLSVIAVFAHEFKDYARKYPDTQFQVTAIGCGLAGHTPEDIAPMFADAPPNCVMPHRFLPTLRTLGVAKNFLFWSE